MINENCNLHCTLPCFENISRNLPKYISVPGICTSAGHFISRDVRPENAKNYKNSPTLERIVNTIIIKPIHTPDTATAQTCVYMTNDATEIQYAYKMLAGIII